MSSCRIRVDPRRTQAVALLLPRLLARAALRRLVAHRLDPELRRTIRRRIPQLADRRRLKRAALPPQILRALKHLLELRHQRVPRARLRELRPLHRLHPPLREIRQRRGAALRQPALQPRPLQHRRSLQRPRRRPEIPDHRIGDRARRVQPGLVVVVLDLRTGTVHLADDRLRRPARRLHRRLVRRLRLPLQRLQTGLLRPVPDQRLHRRVRRPPLTAPAGLAHRPTRFVWTTDPSGATMYSTPPRTIRRRCCPCLFVNSFFGGPPGCPRPGGT
jgi:hypothetical protein